MGSDISTALHEYFNVLRNSIVIKHQQLLFIGDKWVLFHWEQFPWFLLYYLGRDEGYNIPLKWYSHSYPVNEALRSGGCGERDIQTDSEGRKRENGLGVGRRRHICTEKERDRERAGERGRGGGSRGRERDAEKGSEHKPEAEPEITVDPLLCLSLQGSTVISFVRKYYLMWKGSESLVFTTNTFPGL